MNVCWSQVVLLLYLLFSVNSRAELPTGIEKMESLQDYYFLNEKRLKLDAVFLKVKNLKGKNQKIPQKLMKELDSKTQTLHQEIDKMNSILEAH